MKRVALIDGDEVAFKACAVSTDVIDWGDGEPTAMNSPARCAKIAEELTEAWANKVEADEIIVCLSPRDRENFRRRLDPTYKVERTEKPAVYWMTVDRLMERFPYMTFPGCEADDVMGAMSASSADKQPIIVSSDKDMKTVPCWLFNPHKGTKRKVSEQDANLWWMTQTITGDPVDGFPGLPGAGPKAAEKALEGCISLNAMYANVVALYTQGTKRSGPLTPDHALLQARHARILRPGDIDTEKKLIRLWHPREGDPRADIWMPMVPKERKA